MGEVKYVIVRPRGYNSDGDRAILFPEPIPHSSVVHAKVGKAVSAGFCKIDFCKILDSVKVYGRSSSLDLNSREEDADIIRKTLTGLHF